jgi:hypothetical protein
MARKPKLKVVDSFSSSEEKQYFRCLHRLLDEIFKEATNNFEMTWKELAEQSGLTYITVKKLGDRDTRYPRFFTVFKLAEAVGWQLTLTAGKKISKKTKMKAAS